MIPIRTFTVQPALPQELHSLKAIAYNLFWTWNHETIELFRRLDRTLWESSGHNPVAMLGRVDQKHLEELARDEGFRAHLERVFDNYHRYLGEPGWFATAYKDSPLERVAYFTAEFGLTECLPTYSGGLGVLAGDHMKSSSDLGVPVVGVGLLYQQGYFHQYLSADGWQQESYPDNDFHNLPLHLETAPDGSPITIALDYPDGPVYAQVWRVQVGRVPLYLLDTNIPENTRKDDRDITDQLYGGDLETRIRQEMLLGIGGLRALDALGIPPTICHMNEGHSAFLALERIRALMEQTGMNFHEAREAARAGNVFTTHTPVPAGHDVFPPAMMERYFAPFILRLGLTSKEFLALGRMNPADAQEGFSMTVLALRLSGHCNGVSRLHGRVSRHMWQPLWPDVPEKEVPITSISNGIHPGSWISKELADLYNRYLGPRWMEEPANQSVWQGVDEIPGEELWRTHERRRERLVAFARRHLRNQLRKRGAPQREIEEADWVLNPEALTIGFARRFATYKRATLLLENRDRLVRILKNKERPVQIIFAGKAHPRDNPGKELIKKLVAFAREEEIRHHVVFLEDYSMLIARYLVQGCDVWLNTPRRRLEASGTSGMKATANGAINISILDGWWDEVHKQHSGAGWSIGHGEEYDDFRYQDSVESAEIYDLLEQEIVPILYSRGPDGLPRDWIARMKCAMRCLCPVYNTNRMVREYLESCYLPAATRFRALVEDGGRRARALAAWEQSLRRHWPRIRFTHVEAERPAQTVVGDEVPVRVRLHLGELRPEDVTVQIYHGPTDASGQIADDRTAPMQVVSGENGEYEFRGSIPCDRTGRHGYAVRILPAHPDLLRPFALNLILWG